jgi:parallel beta-helix repeat protein
MSFLQTSLRLTFFFVLGASQITLSTLPAIAQNTKLTDTNSLQIAQVNKIIYVSPNGTDTNSGISADQPLRSLTAALTKQIQSGTTIQLAPGIYSAETGEKFPIMIPAGVTVRGSVANLGEETIISGGGVFVSPTFARQNIAVIAGNDSRVEGVTITNSNPRGYALWAESAKNVTITNNTFANSTHDGVFLTGETSANVINNIFTRNGANGLSALGTSTGKIQSNTFDDTGFGIAIGQKSQVAILANRITNNRGGIIVSNVSTPSLRGNLIANNKENGLTILKDRSGQPAVDLGTEASLGQNIFQDNKQSEINNASGVTVMAIGNQIDPKRTQGSIEIVQPSSQLTPPTTPTIANVTFSDVPSDYWAQAFITELAKKDIIKGFPDGSFRPNAPVTRAQFAAMLSQAMNKPAIRSNTKFTDVVSTYWANKAIQRSYTLGFVSGYPDNTFRPDLNIPRVQILVALANGLNYNPAQPVDSTLQKYSDAATIPNYARNSVAAATENRMVVNHPNVKLLNPNQTATRAEVAALIYQALARSGQIPATPSPYIVN